MLVLSASGVQSEARLPFAGLHQLLRPVLSRMGELPALHRSALDGAFGLADGAAHQPFMIALGVLSLLSEASSERPVLLVIEDAHWLDQPTADALAFVGRRVESDAIVMLVAIRDGCDSSLRESGLSELHVHRLDNDAAHRLLRERFPTLTVPACEQLVHEAEGNALALVELGVAADPGPPDRNVKVHPRLPLTVRLERALRRARQNCRPSGEQEEDAGEADLGQDRDAATLASLDPAGSPAS